jgi:tRNA(fMet)-specific endonuclease VapC
MRTYLLDTNACIRILNNSNTHVVSRFSKQSPASVQLCSIVKAELLYGARKSKRVARTLANLEAFFVPLQSPPFDDECAQEYGILRADLERAGTPIGANDLAIAAIARVHDLTVVTNNVDEFSRVVGLRVEDWEQPE